MSGPVIDRAFLGRDPLEVAPELLGAVLTVGPAAGRIVEVEAYRGADDPGSHGFRGPTPRTAVMFGPSGHLYVYFSYGMHWCANVVCGPAGECGAVLIRALEPIAGLEVMAGRRGVARRPTDLCSGPAKLCQALGITGAVDGIDVLAIDAPVRLEAGERLPPTATVRVGLSPGRGETLPWRFLVAGNPHVSRPRP